MSKKIILFNGPPRVGKDTLVNNLIHYYPKSENIKFSEPLKKAIPAFFGLTEEETLLIEEKKDESLDRLLNFSFRNLQISLSEDWGKVIFGKDVFGQIAAKKIANSENNIFFISDCGFFEEAKAVIDTFGEKNCLLIRLYREGCSFNNDSRSYWNHSYLNLQEIHLSNNFTIGKITDTCIEVIDYWI